MPGKNGQVAEQLTTVIILVLILLGVLLVFQQKVWDLKKMDNQKDICKTSVMQYAAANFQGQEFISELKCPTQKLEIVDKDEADIKAKLANAMYDCFDQFGQGKYALFTGKGDGNYCIICHVISFDARMKISAKSFNDYLAQTTVPGTSYKYQTFLLGHKTESGCGEVEGYGQIHDQSYDINTELEYATIFTYGKKGYMGKLMTSFTFGAIGIVAAILTPFTWGGSLLMASLVIGTTGTTGAIIGYNAGCGELQDWDAGIILMPYVPEELVKLGCTELPAEQFVPGPAEEVPS